MYYALGNMYDLHHNNNIVIDRYLGSNLTGEGLFVSGIFVSMLANRNNTYGYTNTNYYAFDDLMFDFASAIFNSAINYNRFDETTMRNLASAIKSYL